MEKYLRTSLRRAFVIFCGVNMFHSYKYIYTYIYIIIYIYISLPGGYLLMAHLRYHQAAGHTVLYVGATDAEALVGLGKDLWI